jgi:hypothetical protein
MPTYSEFMLIVDDDVYAGLEGGKTGEEAARARAKAAFSSGALGVEVFARGVFGGSPTSVRDYGWFSIVKHRQKAPRPYFNAAARAIKKTGMAVPLVLPRQEYATLLLDSAFSYPHGTQEVLWITEGITPGERRSFSILQTFRFDVIGDRDSQENARYRVVPYREKATQFAELLTRAATEAPRKVAITPSIRCAGRRREHGLYR